MAAANVTSSVVSSSFSSLKKMDSIPGSLQQAMAVELRGAGKGQRSRALRGQRVRVAGVRNAAPELVELEPASQGSQLLGDDLCFSIACGPGFVVRIGARNFSATDSLVSRPG